MTDTDPAAALSAAVAHNQRLEAVVRVMHERIQRGGPTNYLTPESGYVTEEQAAIIRAALVPESATGLSMDDYVASPVSSEG